ncbi:MAG: GAP family protein [Ilumatobacteraceae bacterium]
MWSSFGEALPQAVGIAVSPLPVVLVILMLVSPRGRANGPVFLAGWIVGVAVLTGVAFAVADAADAATDASTAEGVDAMQLGLGLLFLWLAVKQFRSRPAPGTEPATPKLLRAVDSFGPGKALGLGLAASMANPKNLSLAISGGAGMAAAGATGSDGVVAVILFVVVASIGVGAPVVVQLVMGDRSAGVLASWKTWLVANNATVMTVLFGVLGSKMVGAGLGLLG